MLPLQKRRVCYSVTQGGYSQRIFQPVLLELGPTLITAISPEGENKTLPLSPRQRFVFALSCFIGWLIDWSAHGRLGGSNEYPRVGGKTIECMSLQNK